MKNSLEYKIFKFIMCEFTNKTYRNIINILNNYGYNKIYNLNSGFVLSNLNAVSCMEINDILENYIINSIKLF